MGDRLVVGHETLDLAAEVRILLPQPMALSSRGPGWMVLSHQTGVRIPVALPLQFVENRHVTSFPVFSLLGSCSKYVLIGFQFGWDGGIFSDFLSASFMAFFISLLLGNCFIMQKRSLRLDCRATESWLFYFIKLIWGIFIQVI